MPEESTVIGYVGLPITNVKFTIYLKRDCYVTLGEIIQVEDESTGVTILGQITDVKLMPLHEAKHVSVDFLLRGFVDVNRLLIVTANARVLGALDRTGKIISTWVTKPGLPVKRAEARYVRRILFVPDGLMIRIGSLIGNEDVNVTISANRLLRSCTIILGETGTGKTFTASVVATELLKRKRDIAVIIFDEYGEYNDIIGINQEEVIYIRGEEIELDISEIGAHALSKMLNLTEVQTHILDEALSTLPPGAHSIHDIIDAVRGLRGAHPVAKSSLCRRLYSLLGYLTPEGRVKHVTEIVKPGRISIIDLRDLNTEAKQLLLAWVLNSTLKLRMQNKLSPVLFILERASIYASPEEDAVSKPVLQEAILKGRKLQIGLIMIERRPADIDSKIMSLCDIALIHRIGNPYDQRMLAKGLSFITREVLREVSLLGSGEAILCGCVVRSPVIIRIRRGLMMGRQDDHRKG